MTGFGRTAGALSSRFFVAVTAKSVNHRFLEAGVRLPEYLWELEPLVRQLASDTFARGKVDISVRVQRTAQPEYSVRINEQIANAVVPQLRALATEPRQPDLQGSWIERWKVSKPRELRYED